MTDTLLHWHQGKVIARVKYPAWHLEADRMEREDGLVLEEALKAVGAREQVFEFNVENRDSAVFVTIGPEGDRVVEMSADCFTVGYFYIEDTDSWFSFFRAHLLPFIHALATHNVGKELHRIGNVLTSFARHGEGTHVDRWEGTSKIDDAADARRHACAVPSKPNSERT